MTKTTYQAAVRAPLLIFVCIGCAGNARVEIPRIDANVAARSALDQHDRDGDHVLSREELRGCPAILVKLSEYDADGDQCVSAQEIVRRIRAWEDTRVGFVTGYTCRVLYDGQPLADAEVRLVPQSFLSGALKSASGISDQAGIASLAIADEELPKDLHGLRGVQFGLYKVQVTHPSRAIADKFNTDTILGCEIYPSGDPETFTFRIGPQ